MPLVNVACWSMRETLFAGASTASRADWLGTVALNADTAMAAHGGKRVLVVPEYLFTANGTILSRDAKHEIYRKLENISAAVPQLILIAGSIAYKKGLVFKDTYNVCPVLLGGRIVKKLYKANDDGVYQNNGSFKTKTDNGKGTPVAAVDGLSLGFDICLDYNNHRLGQYLTAHRLPRPDLHIQISGSNLARLSYAEAKIGGMYVHCDLGTKGSGAWTITGHDAVALASGTPIARAPLVTPAGGNLALYRANV